MTGSFDSLGHFLLIFQRSTGETAGQNLTLFVHEFLQEFTIFVVDVLDTALFETAVFFLLNVNCYRSNVFNVILLCHNYSACSVWLDSLLTS